MNKKDIITCHIYKINKDTYVVAANIKEAIDIFVSNYNNYTIYNIETISTKALIVP